MTSPRIEPRPGEHCLALSMKRRHLWLQVVLIHPFHRTRSSPIGAKIDTGSGRTVIPQHMVDWFAKKGDALVRMGEPAQAITGKTSTPAECFDVQLEISDARGQIWRVDPSMLPPPLVGFPALERSWLLIGTDLLSQCIAFAYHGRDNEGYIIIP